MNKYQLKAKKKRVKIKRKFKEKYGDMWIEYYFHMYPPKNYYK